MANDKPQPMTASDCDLRGYEFMPLFGNRLFGSRLYRQALRNPRAGMAALKLWWVAWQQCPAGSLPKDDEDLAVLADFGMDIKAWKKVKEIALHGFIECNDNRLYHPMLCEEAKSAFEKRRKERDRKARMRAAKAGGDDHKDPGQSAESDDDVPGLSHGTDAGQHMGQAAGQTTETPRDIRDLSALTGQDRTVREVSKADSVLRTASADAEPQRVPCTDFDDVLPVRDRLWADGWQIVSDMTGKPERACRALIGRWLKATRDDCARVLDVLHQAKQLRPLDPIPWVEAALADRTKRKGQFERLSEGLGNIVESDFDRAFKPFAHDFSGDFMDLPSNRRLI